MKHLRWWLAAGLLLAGLGLATACGDDDDGDSDAGEVELTERDNGSTVTVEDGGHFTVLLTSNATTGFTWRVAGDLPGMLEQEGEPEYIPPATASPAVGAAGQQRFTFKVTKAGEATLKLEYVRPFETGVPPAQTFEVALEAE